MQVFCRGEAIIRRGGPQGDEFTIAPEELDWHQGGIIALENGLRIEHTAYFTHPELGFLSWTAWESPLGVQAERDTDVGEHELVQDFEFGLEYTPDEVAERHALVNQAVTWFLGRYEDPAMRTGYDSSEGGYLWDHGGPYDAREEIQDAFDLPEDLLGEAVREVQSRGIYEWAAGDWWSDDRDEGPDDSDGIFSIDDPLPDISDFDFDQEDADDEYADGDFSAELDIPEQGPGLAFVFSGEGIIELAAQGALTPDENEQTEPLRSVLVGATDDLLATLAGSNAFGAIAGIAQQYRLAVGASTISVDLLYGLGIRLENSRARLQALIGAGDYPEMGLIAGEALDSVLALHGPLILSTERGRYLIRLAQEYWRTDLETAAYREAARGISEAAANAPNLVSPQATEAVTAANNDIGKGPHPERSLQIAHSANRNLLITIAKAVGFLFVTETVAVGLASSVPGLASVEITKQVANLAWEFMANNAPVLQQFAAVSGLADMGWLSALLRRVASIGKRR